MGACLIQSYQAASDWINPISRNFYLNTVSRYRIGQFDSFYRAKNAQTKPKSKPKNKGMQLIPCLLPKRFYSSPATTAPSDILTQALPSSTITHQHKRFQFSIKNTTLNR